MAKPRKRKRLPGMSGRKRALPPNVTVADLALFKRMMALNDPFDDLEEFTSITHEIMKRDNPEATREDAGKLTLTDMEELLDAFTQSIQGRPHRLTLTPGSNSSRATASRGSRSSASARPPGRAR
jgi:hypothetical protein